LWDLDLAFADVVATSTQPALGAIRMAWWRERLEEMDDGTGLPAEPRLVAVQSELLARGVTGAELSRLEDCWLPLLEPLPWGAPVADGLRRRGRMLFRIGAGLLGEGPSAAELAGALWSLADGAKFCRDEESREYLISEARGVLSQLPRRFPVTLRPLTILAALTAYDLRPGGRLGRVGVALAHRLRGSVPGS
jgi:phytoene synthase